MRDTTFVGLPGGSDPIVTEISRLRHSRGQDVGQPLPKLIADSWKRCLADYNLQPDFVPRAAVLTHSEIVNLMGPYEELLAVAEPEIERLFLRLADSDYLVSLASPQGVMVLFRCPTPALHDMYNLGVLPGSVWLEERQGTNGVGTCLRAGRAVVIAGDQHYGAGTQSLTCFTAPVFGAKDAIDSVLNVTTACHGDHRTNRVVHDIVQRSARRIESGYFMRVFRENMVLRLASGVGSLDGADEGRIAFDDQGRILAVTSNVMSLLGRTSEQLLGKTVEAVGDIGTSIADIRPDQPIPIVIDGKYVQAELVAPKTRTGFAPLFKSPLDSTVSPLDHESYNGIAIRRADQNGADESIVDATTGPLLTKAERLLKAALPVIINGETGTGKTTFAEAAVRRSFGAATQIIAVDCRAAGGHVLKQIISRSRAQAEPTTLLLDHIECLEEAGQIALMNFLDGRPQYKGSVIAVIALTTSGPEQLSAEDKLKSGLLYRLKGGTISLAPLRLNPDLRYAILKCLAIEQEALANPTLRIDDQALPVLVNYHWPGNLRELRNALRHASALCEGGRIGISNLPSDIVAEIARKDLTARSHSEASRIESALRYNGGNVSSTARYLGVSRATLYRKIMINKVRDEDAEHRARPAAGRTKAH
jgi:sigma-54 dependent transcriptional regulator, acetoin dehydrogenase operon transcriptional activator AcoR